MTQILIGPDSSGIECVKITKDNYDPVTTSDSLRSRFYFNSKWPNQVTTPEIEIAPWVSYSGERVVRTPSGSSVSTFALMRYDVGPSPAYSWYFVRGKLRYPDVRYDLPLMEVKRIDPANGRYKQLKMTRREFGAPYGSSGVLGGYVGTGDTGTWHRRQSFDYGAPLGTFTLDYSPGILESISTETEVLLVWNLPGNNVPLDGPTSIPSGTDKYAVEINEAACRVAKPGFDVRTATAAQLAFDSSGRPLNVIAAADIAIPTGASSYNTGITLPEHVVLDMSCYNDTEIYYPMKLSGDDNGYGIDYWFDGSLIRFSNSDPACRARFVLYGADTSPPSSGANDVIRQFLDGAELVTQLLRPGASATPNFQDIIVDSRRPVIQIIDEGYLAVPTGVTSQTVTYDAAGLFPFLKYMTVHGSGLTEEVRAPRVNRRFLNSLSPGGLAGDGSYCKYNSASATFYTAKGQSRYRYNSSLNGVTDVYDDNPIVGIRYFVLGIPTP